jgi:hypothetical protein
MSDLETNIFGLKMVVKRRLEFFCFFEIPLAPSEILLPRAKKSAQKG